jgi:tetratricopeptide (TPR) repeat protein
MPTFAPNSEPSLENQGVLASWKGIAAYFGCNVRTAKRWERERGLPVRRAPGKKIGTVFARTSELDAWLESREAEQVLDSAASTGGTVGHLDDVEQASPKSAATNLPPPASSKAHPAKQVAFLWWRPWILAASVLLVFAVTLFWKVGNRQTAAATTFTRLDTLNGKPHIPAPGATELFLRGRYYWNLRTADGLAKAIDSYTQAIVTDPSYAEAYAGLAESYDLLPQFGQADLGDSLRKAEHAADRAIELNPNLASAHTAKAFALYYRDWDIAGSDAEFREALALDPNSAQAHQWYASTLQCRSEGAEALRQIDEAVRLDPTSPAIAADAALFQADFGEFRSGVKALREIEQTQPLLASPAQFLKELDFDAGDFPAYVEDLRRLAAITKAPDDVALAKAVERGWARGGRAGLLEARVEALKTAFDHGSETGFVLGETLLMLGRRQEALFYFRASVDRHATQLIAIRDYPWAKKLSDDPGYAALFAQISQRVRGATPSQPEQAQIAFQLPQ